MSEIINGARLEHDLRALGLGSGDIVNVHSSMKSIGSQVDGGPKAVIQALLNVIDAESGGAGTLLMPSFTQAIAPNDLRTMPSRLGLITETFRQWPGVLRSNDPTHSVAGIGKDADEILAGHEDIAPSRKWDPGKQWDWQRFHRSRAHIRKLDLEVR